MVGLGEREKTTDHDDDQDHDHVGRSPVTHVLSGRPRGGPPVTPVLSSAGAWSWT
ncbi:hypothetical protein DB32_004984 [Sandaracinus amylolyticus]|uniref:Uncharacterized protein n=1 Tax=Sandaracinus amylolyticus TaxID=927083 RepID=A0A0F6YJH8_9BACT|nr:hypothetical protein DB32_004984 [Sandaracinus amylolyticus]